MQSTLWNTLTVLGRLCLLKGNVSELPYSNITVGVLLLIAVAVLTGQYFWVTSFPLWQIALGVSAHFILLVGAFYFLLQLRKIPTNRLNKFLQGFLGTQLLFLALISIFAMLLQGQGLLPLEFVCGLWEIAVQVNIMRQVFEIKLPVALLWLIAIGLLTSLPLLPFIATVLPKVTTG